MAIIAQISTSNTFSQWLTATQNLITKVNDLTDGGPGGPGSITFYANTNLSVANNLTVGGDLTVTGNIVLDSVSFDDINSNGSASFANNLTVGGNTTLANATVSYGNFQTANVTSLQGSSNTLIYSTISLVRETAVSSFIQANSSYGHANAGFIQANSSYDLTNSSFIQANSSYDHANAAFNSANTALNDAVALSIALG